MKIDDIIDSIFGTAILENYERSDFLPCPNQRKYVHRLRLVNSYIEMSMSCKSNDTSSDDRNGRTGPDDVKFLTPCGKYLHPMDKLSIMPSSPSCTFVATAGVYRGKWMYEATIITTGPIQLGWATRESKFNDEYGVGDTIDSYAYNGYTQKKWHLSSEIYGVRWNVNDFIGCAIDLDERTMNFYRNGRDMGIAFENIPISDNTLYHPAVTFAETGCFCVNFGSFPFKYPINGYRPLQAAPSVKYIQTSLCLQWFTRMINFIELLKDPIMILEDSNITVYAFLMALVSIIIKHIAPLLTIPYITVKALIPFMEALYITEVPNPLDYTICNKRLMTCMNILWVYLEKSELYVCYDMIITYIISTYVHVSDLNEYSNQYRTLAFLTRLCQHDTTRRYFIQKILFNSDHLPKLLYVRPLNNEGFSELMMKDNCWPTYPVIDKNKENYIQVRQKIEDVTCNIESLGISFIITLLNGNDGIDGRPTSRTIFLNEFRKYIQTFMSQCSITLKYQDTYQFDANLFPALSTCFNLIIAAVQHLWKTEVTSSIKPHIRCRSFYDETINYHGIERLGGDLSYLQKMYKTDLIQRLGSHHKVIVNMQQKTTTNEENPSNDEGTSFYLRHIKSPFTDVCLSLIELLDSVIFFYTLIAKHLNRLSQIYVTHDKYLKNFNKVQEFLESVENDNNNNAEVIKKQIRSTREVFKIRLEEQSRYIMWIQANTLTQKKFRRLTWLLRAIILTIFKANDEVSMLKFMPNYYLTTMIDMWSVVHDHICFMPSVEQETYQEVTRDIARILCELIHDPRVMQVNTRDIIYTTLGRFVKNYKTMKLLESIPITTRRCFLIKLLTSFDSDDWPKSSAIMVYFWHPNGFAFRWSSSEARVKYGPKFLFEDLFFRYDDAVKHSCPSPVFQKHIMDLLHNRSLKTKFLKNILDRVNWSFSEFMNTMTQISQSSVNNQMYISNMETLETCSTSYILTISALRILEMVCVLIPLILNDWNEHINKILVEQLCDLLSQIFHRILSPASCFRYIVEMNVPDLLHVRHFPILTAAFGILSALIKQEMHYGALSLSKINEVPKITRSLLMRSKFRIEYLNSLLAMECTATTGLILRKGLFFEKFNGSQNILFEEAQEVEKVKSYLKQCHILLPTNENAINDENICTICYESEISVCFEPCFHSSCHNCIDQYLLSNRRCFFCKVLICIVRNNLNGEILYEFSTDSSTSDIDD